MPQRPTSRARSAARRIGRYSAYRPGSRRAAAPPAPGPHPTAGPPSGLAIERQLAAEPGVAAEPAEHEVGVGHRRLGAAAAIARRTRHRLGALRADAQRATLVDPGDGAAAGADRVDVDDRDADRRAFEAGLARHLRRAVEHQADVGAGAAHIERDDVAEAGEARDMGAGDDPAGRPGQYGMHR